MDLLHLLHDTGCGALAAAGFGILFNIGFRGLPWCAASGALALAVRALFLESGWSMEAASLVAALVVGFALQLFPSQLTISRSALDMVGCIPMVPGGFATKAIIGLFAITGPNYSATNETLLTAVDNVLRVMLTIGAIGTGLAVPNLLMRRRTSKQLEQGSGTILV